MTLMQLQNEKGYVPRQRLALAPEDAKANTRPFRHPASYSECLQTVKLFSWLVVQ